MFQSFIKPFPIRTLPLRISLPKLVIPSRYLQTQIQPPSHFTKGAKVPPSYDEISVSDHQQPPAATTPPSAKNDRSLRELTLLVAMFTLGYIAVDNYVNRMKLEKLNSETTAINLKTLQVQQANFLQARKKKDLQMLQERKDNQKRNFKMALHVAFLRHQLIQLGHDPIAIDKVINEYEKSVKIDNSLKNVTGQSLWINDDSELKNYLPDVHDYDKKNSL